MANPFYGQNKADDALDWAKNATSGDAFGTVEVAGANEQYGTAANPMSKYDLNRTITCGNATGPDIFLPAVSSSDAGMWLKIKVGVTLTTDAIITAASGDLLIGSVFLKPDADGATTPVYFAADGSDDLIITLNGGTKGGKIGSELFLQVNKNGYWNVEGYLVGTATLVTPFS